MINMISHGHGMYLPVLVKLFHFALKCYFFSNTVRCVWHILYINRLVPKENVQCVAKISKVIQKCYQEHAKYGALSRVHPVCNSSPPRGSRILVILNSCHSNIILFNSYFIYWLQLLMFSENRRWMERSFDRHRSSSRH